ncbi:MAG: U32 family peptidase, partial [Bdellovibrionales bacterium]|nr:U32 family peptidase [Bdellovibrionales bacterium]
MEMCLAAIHGGANAIYVGMPGFNARGRSVDQSVEQLKEMIDLSHLYGVKVHIAFNILIFEDEINHAIEMLDEVIPLGPDALIIQDVGLAKIVKDIYPEQVIHGSTQMTVTNDKAIEFLGELDIKRFVLGRENSLDEIRKIRAATDKELEVFVHGALCVAYSGQCFTSESIGGRSANRGQCAQSCRFGYELIVDGEKKDLIDKDYLVSPQDLCGINEVSKLREIGIESFKIEGRLKQPDYIKNVVSAYRQVLDAPAGQEEDVLKEARLTLSGSLGRRWSHGFLIQEELGDLLQYDSMGVSGQLVGSVEQTKGTGFKVRLIRRIHLGDRLRIQPRSGEEGPAVTVTRISLGTRLVNVGRKDDTVFIHCDREIPDAGLVYKIGESRKDDIPNMDSLPEHNPGRRVDLNIRIGARGMSVRALNLRDRDGGELAVDWREPPDPASNRPIEPDTLKELFSATRDAGFRSGHMDVNISGSWFIPAGVLKQRRREFWDLVTRTAGEVEEDTPTVFTFPVKNETAVRSAGR